MTIRTKVAAALAAATRALIRAAASLHGRALTGQIKAGEAEVRAADAAYSRAVQHVAFCRAAVAEAEDASNRSWEDNLLTAKRFNALKAAISAERRA